MVFLLLGHSPAEQQGFEDHPECFGQAGSRELSSNHNSNIDFHNVVTFR